jgi:hypothetical protein
MARKKVARPDPMATMGSALKEVSTCLKDGTVPKDTIDVDFKKDDIAYTEDDRKGFESGKMVMESSADDGFSGSDMRINMGRFYTEDEWEKKHERILKEKLP